MSRIPKNESLSRKRGELLKCEQGPVAGRNIANMWALQRKPSDGSIEGKVKEA